MAVAVHCLVRLARWLSAWAWNDEVAALRRASILREIANQRINENPANDSWWLGVLEGAAHCQTGEMIGGGK